jgi:hypothetical protein
MEKVRDTLLWGGRNSIALLEVSEASPARPSDKKTELGRVNGSYPDGCFTRSHKGNSRTAGPTFKYAIWLLPSKSTPIHCP